MKYYRNYRWKEGKPVGIGKTSREAPRCFRIVSDPYHKWLSIEMYREGQFAALIYDSHLLDFRKLKPAVQLAWRKEAIDDRESWIYNEDDRLILREKYSESGCAVYSLHGILICRYEFDEHKARVVLFDSHSLPVLVQQYRTFDRGEFIDLIDENRSPSEEYSSAHIPRG